MFKLIAGATEIKLSAGVTQSCVTESMNSGAVFFAKGLLLLSEALFRNL